MRDYSEWFAERLRRGLGEMSQADLLAILKENGFEMTQQRLSHYMNGRNYPDPPVLKELARAMGVSADWLLGLTEQQLPADDLNEMVNRAKGEGRIDKVMRRLPPEEQRAVLQYADYLASRVRVEQEKVAHETEAEESQQISIEAQQWLESIEKTKGLPTRQEIEKIFRDKGLLVDGAA